jgi:hypothetical protein
MIKKEYFSPLSLSYLKQTDSFQAHIGGMLQMHCPLHSNGMITKYMNSSQIFTGRFKYKSWVTGK